MPSVPSVPEVLFVCVHNAGRSQMAAALLEHHAHGQIVVSSAGSAPADHLNPAVIEVMTEQGLDLSQQLPTKLRTDDVDAADVVKHSSRRSGPGNRVGWLQRRVDRRAHW